MSHGGSSVIQKTAITICCRFSDERVYIALSYLRGDSGALYTGLQEFSKYMIIHERYIPNKSHRQFLWYQIPRNTAWMDKVRIEVDQRSAGNGAPKHRIDIKLLFESI